jgi:hypothetical protein
VFLNFPPELEIFIPGHNQPKNFWIPLANNKKTDSRRIYIMICYFIIVSRHHNDIRLCWPAFVNWYKSEEKRGENPTKIVYENTSLQNL